MISRDHHDKDYRTVDEIQGMLEQQLAAMTSTSRKQLPGYTRNGGYGGVGGGVRGRSSYSHRGGYGRAAAYGEHTEPGLDDEYDHASARGGVEDTATQQALGEWMTERCRYIPLRLT